jgi:hypothetical protein
MLLLSGPRPRGLTTLRQRLRSRGAFRRLREKLREWDFKRLRQSVQKIDCGVLSPPFQSTDVGAVNSCVIGKALLGDPAFDADPP